MSVAVHLGLGARTVIHPGLRVPGKPAALFKREVDGLRVN